MAVEWKPEFSVGYDHIDRQHQELFRRINTLIAACREGRGRERVKELLLYLDEYTLFHFGDEENLMETHGYPGSEEHRDQHRTFCDKLAGLREILQKEGSSVNLLVATNEAVLQWLINHIRQTDTALGAFLKEKA